MTTPDVLPEHMDRWSRNRRLYETLKGMGLYVSAIPEPNDPTKIREMIVAVDLPAAAQDAAQQAAEGGVIGAVDRPQIGNVIKAAESGRVNVVDFPSIRGAGKMAEITKRQRTILKMLSDGERWREDEIKSSHTFLQQMYLAGWLDGAGYPDKNGFGNFPNTRQWWITAKGRDVIG